LLLIAFAIAMVVSLPMFLLLQSQSFLVFMAVMVALGVLVSVPLGVAPATMIELFPTRDRLTGYSIPYNIGLGVFGGSTPMIVTRLIETTGNVYIPAIYLISADLVSVVGLYLMKDRSREPLR